MSFPVACQCGQRFTAQDHLENTTVRCRSCGIRLTVRRPRVQGLGAVPIGDAISVTCQCGRSYSVEARFAGQAMRCKACDSVLHVPSAAEAASLGELDDDPLGACTAWERSARPTTISPGLPSGYRTAAPDGSAIVKTVGVAAAVVAGVAVLFGMGYTVVSALKGDLSERESAPAVAVSPQAPSHPPPKPPEPEKPPSKPPGPEEPPPKPPPAKPPPPPPEDLPQGLIRWFEDPTGRRAGLRRVGPAGSPHSHYSWMCDLLPYLGHQDLYDAFDFSKHWTDKQNLQRAGVIVPEFQNPSDDRKRYDGYPFGGLALTHFVGMSGVEDGRNVVAASLPRSDPRAGVFGYDEVAAMEDITDGASNTIMIIGSGELASPWAVGGGGTIRGARQPYFDRLSGFGSRGRKSEGALAVMADGSVRFVSSDVDPSAFRAMCTIHGGETVDVSRWTAPTNFGR